LATPTKEEQSTMQKSPQLPPAQARQIQFLASLTRSYNYMRGRGHSRDESIALARAYVARETGIEAVLKASGGRVDRMRLIGLAAKGAVQ
jgi:hypothetical protein